METQFLMPKHYICVPHKLEWYCFMCFMWFLFMFLCDVLRWNAIWLEFCMLKVPLVRLNMSLQRLNV